MSSIMDFWNEKAEELGYASGKDLMTERPLMKMGFDELQEFASYLTFMSNQHIEYENKIEKEEWNLTARILQAAGATLYREVMLRQ